MLGPDWKDNTRMTQVKRREFQCEPPSFDFSCAIETALCTYVDSVRVVVGTGPREAEDAKALEFMSAHPEMGDRELAKSQEAVWPDEHYTVLQVLSEA
jgi:hypothetical protein